MMITAVAKYAQTAKSVDLTTKTVFTSKHSFFLD